MKVTNIKVNIMGTISFDAKFKGMRKPQDFIVYPNPTKERIMIQSKNRIGLIAGDKVEISTATCLAMWGFRPKKGDVIDNIEELLTAIRATASEKAGTSGIVYCDNSTAKEV